MSKKFLSLLLTLVTLLAAAPPRASAAEEMTEEDGREARTLAVNFLRRLRETDDFAPLVSEFFPEDFEQRLKQFVRDAPPGDAENGLPIPCDRALLLRSEPGELRRLYVAMMNFWNLSNLIHNVAWAYAAVEYGAAGRDASAERASVWDRRSEFTRAAVPEEAHRIAESDPFLKMMFGLVRADYVESDASPEDEEKEFRAKYEASYMHDAARLRSFVEKLERCVALIREGVAKLRADAKSLAASHGIEKDAGGEDDFKVYHVGDLTLEAPAFGLAAGALVIRARIFPFELAMTRAEGKLQILAVYPDTDGD
jgi:hypothetical protein